MNALPLTVKHTGRALWSVQAASETIAVLRNEKDARGFARAIAAAADWSKPNTWTSGMWAKVHSIRQMFA